MTTISYGEEKPVDLGQNAAAWANTRRAAFVLE
jgi:outer membrane protein OmpA-like peptidoglycan-associated protein